MSDSKHSIGDHAFGADHHHDHGHGDFDHDHDHDFASDADTLTPLNFVSMGLDIGSSSTQVAFSRLRRRHSHAHHKPTPTYHRETIYLSPIMATPFSADGLLDIARLQGVVEKAFVGADLSPDDIETGVVILTGEAATRINAPVISKVMAEGLGELVCAAAGHHMEAMLSAHGSGAVAASLENGGRRILVIDIGGATTKLALVDKGKVLSTAALNAGGRLMVIDRQNNITRLDAAGALFARDAGFDWRVGETIDPLARSNVAAMIADAIVAAAAGQLSPELMLTAPLAEIGNVDGVMFAGGVGEFVYGREKRDFNDLGLALGKAMRNRVDAGHFQFPLLPPGECIRATVLGAAEHSLQLSGDTIFISDHAALLPVRNLPVVRPPLDLGAEELIPADIASAIGKHVAAFDLADDARPVALSVSWFGAPSHHRLRALAEGIAESLANRIAARTPIYVLLQGDVALNLGRLLKDELAVQTEIMVVDSIETVDFDFVDIGRVRLPSHTVPVTIKSLLFGDRRQ